MIDNFSNLKLFLMQTKSIKIGNSVFFNKILKKLLEFKFVSIGTECLFQNVFEIGVVDDYHDDSYHLIGIKSEIVSLLLWISKHYKKNI